MTDNAVFSIIDRINCIYGLVVALLSYILGEHWTLFVFYLALNVGDFVSRWITARITGTENSKAGCIGILKKLGCWIMIALAFGVGAVFIEMGETVGINLKVTTFVGWFVLASLTINEIRSILENLVEGGFKIPNILIKGLEVANKAIDSGEEILNKTEDET